MILKIGSLCRTLHSGADLLRVRPATGGGRLEADKDTPAAASETVCVDVLAGGCGCMHRFMFVGVRRRARIWEGQSGISHCH